MPRGFAAVLCGSMSLLYERDFSYLFGRRLVYTTNGNVCSTDLIGKYEKNILDFSPVSGLPSA